MTTREYLAASGMNEMQLSDILGHKTTASVKRKMDDEMPKGWVRVLETESEKQGDSATPDPESDSSSEREPNFTDEQLNDWINDPGRQDDKDPKIEGVHVIGPQQIKLSTIEGYIKMVYTGAEMMARRNGDDIAAETINRYTPQYTEAWLDYIKADPRVMKWLESLMIGTPLGNLIGIHAISIGAYVLARATAREIAKNSTGDGTGETEL